MSDELARQKAKIAETEQKLEQVEEEFGEAVEEQTKARAWRESLHSATRVDAEDTPDDFEYDPPFVHTQAQTAENSQIQLAVQAASAKYMAEMQALTAQSRQMAADRQAREQKARNDDAKASPYGAHSSFLEAAQRQQKEAEQVQKANAAPAPAPVTVGNAIVTQGPPAAVAVVPTSLDQLWPG